ncbi:MAG: SMC family ATPase [Candidatus Anstonellaceae archaeon]
MITSLTLENWKSHSKSEFKFGKGTNVLVGRMGSGKSSVLDALCFALYGTFPKMSRRDQTTEHLVNIASLATGEAQYARVVLQFEKGGANYEVERKIGKKITDAEVRCEGKLVQKGAKAVTDYVVSALGVDYELFTRAIYSEQNKIDYLLSLNPRARKGEIDWLLGLGQFDEAREAAQSVAGKLAEQAELFAADAKTEKISEAKTKAGELSAEVDGRKAKLLQLKRKAQELGAKLAERQAKISELEKVKTAWKAAQADFDRQKGAFERLKSECSGKKKPDEGAIVKASELLKKSEAALSEQKAAAKKLQAELSAVKSEIAVEENKKKNAEGRLKRKQENDAKLAKLCDGTSLEQLEKELAELKAEAEQLNEQHSWLHAQRQQLTEAIGVLASGVAKCPVCDSDLAAGKAEKISGEKKAQLEKGVELAGKLAEELAAKKLALAALEGKISDVKAISKENERLVADGIDVASFEKAIAEKNEARKIAEAELAKNESKIVELEKEKDFARKEMEDMQRASKLFEELSASEAKLAECEAKLKATSFDEAAYENERKGAEALRADFASADTEAKGEEKQLKLLEEMLAQQKESLAALQQKEKLAKRYAEAAASMQIYKNSLAAAQTELRSTLVEEINASLAEIWPSVYPYADYGGVKFEADDKDYRLLMQKEGWREVDAVASGGERACLCLALRIAFATVLTPDIGWLILDEPTHNLDADAVALLSEAINSKIPSIVEQTFVITHDPALGETGEGVVFRLERDKGKNEATRVLTG